MDKYIFLDIDGVIATPETIEEGYWALTPRCQDFLGRILQDTGAKIVLSSSWRLNTLEETKKFMSEKGFLYCDHIIGVTIRAYQHIKGIHLSIPRGVEIKQWIDTNIRSENGKNWNDKKPGKDYRYVIIDDESDMLLEHKNNFVYTCSKTGLVDDDVEKAVAILNNGFYFDYNE